MPLSAKEAGTQGLPRFGRDDPAPASPFPCLGKTRLQQYLDGSDDEDRRFGEESRELRRAVRYELLVISRKLKRLRDQSLRSKEDADGGAREIAESLPLNRRAD